MKKPPADIDAIAAPEPGKAREKAIGVRKPRRKSQRPRRKLSAERRRKMAAIWSGSC